MSVGRAVQVLAPDLVALRQDLHRHPELGFQEERTANIAAERMRRLGLEVKTRIGGNRRAG